MWRWISNSVAQIVVCLSIWTNYGSASWRLTDRCRGKWLNKLYVYSNRFRSFSWQNISTVSECPEIVGLYTLIVVVTRLGVHKRRANWCTDAARSRPANVDKLWSNGFAIVPRSMCVPTVTLIILLIYYHFSVVSMPSKRKWSKMKKESRVMYRRNIHHLCANIRKNDRWLRPK